MERKIVRKMLLSSTENISKMMIFDASSNRPISGLFDRVGLTEYLVIKDIRCKSPMMTRKMACDVLNLRDDISV
jgi:hypothetical protein